MDYKKLKGCRDVKKEYLIMTRKEADSYKPKKSIVCLGKKAESGKLISAVRFTNQEQEDNYCYSGSRPGYKDGSKFYFRIVRTAQVIEDYGMLFMDDTFYFETTQEGNDVYTEFLEEGYVKITEEEFESFDRYLYDSYWN